MCKSTVKPNLHSTMVRFSIIKIIQNGGLKMRFTFHYGQIFNQGGRASRMGHQNIYIPLWLDLLFQSFPNPRLHVIKFTFHYGQIYYLILELFCEAEITIYIPLWLDLLYKAELRTTAQSEDLHSTMVRFIILADYRTWANETAFTFHYGQIYYRFLYR